MGIKIGDKNKIKNTVIAENMINSEGLKKNNKNLYEKHPFIFSIIASIIASLIIMMYSFWDKIILFIENIFGR